VRAVLGTAQVAERRPHSRRQPRWSLLVAVAVVGALVLLYVADLVVARGETARGEMARGVSVAGIDVGGLDRAAAEQRLRTQLEPRLSVPVAVRAGAASASIDPRVAGLTLDWAATLDLASAQPLNPWTRLRSLLSPREVGVVTRADRNVVAQALESLRPDTDRASVEGDIRFDGVRPVPIEPRSGQRLDAPAAVEPLVARWAFGTPVELPVVPVPVSVRPDGLRAALEGIARPAVAAPVRLDGEGKQATVQPEQIAAVLGFEPDGHGGLRAVVDTAKVAGQLQPQLADTERPARNAAFTFEGDRPTILPSEAGRVIDYNQTLAGLLDVLRRPTARVLPVVYLAAPPELTTAEANQLGIREVIGEFTTSDFAPDSGRNIRRAAEQVNGAMVRPGETFSLNGHTGPRGPAQGYIEAGVIEDGRSQRGLGGGTSQLATTLYNAAYFAGMTDVEHQEHSFYISRYPVAREATVSEGNIDLKFRNEGPTGALIQTIWTESSITIKIWGTRRYEVTSTTGPRTDNTPPSTEVVPAGPDCIPSPGAPGFTATDTRALRDLHTGQTRQETRTVTYKPQPKTVCTD
jgi:vancomycin resistance protein YoaR